MYLTPKFQNIMQRSKKQMKQPDCTANIFIFCLVFIDTTLYRSNNCAIWTGKIFHEGIQNFRDLWRRDPSLLHRFLRSEIHVHLKQYQAK